MGTRSDYFVGIGPNAEWIGSATYDGGPDCHGARPLAAQSVKEFRDAVEAMLADETVLTTRPAEGWPWPWRDLLTTDFAYAWDPKRGCPVLTCFGREWMTLQEWNALDDDGHDNLRKMNAAEVVDMSKGPQGDIWGKSGLIVVSGKPR